MANVDLLYNRIIATIGPELYRATAAAAQSAAGTTGQPNAPAEFVSDVPQDINDLIWDSELGDLEKIELMLRVYRDMPCYALLFGLALHYPELPPLVRAEVLRRIRRILSSPDDTLAGPLAYALWCDFFEGPATVREAWDALVDTSSNPYLLERVLSASGPVPFSLKNVLYNRLVADKKWHQAIYRSLLHSSFDVYGSIDKQKARALLARLDIPANSEGLADLQAALAEKTQVIGA